MRRRLRQSLGRLAGLIGLLPPLALLGCTEPLIGQPSLSLLSVADTRGHYEPVGPARTASDCSASYLFLFGGGDPPSHEAVLSRMLAESNAHVLLNARMTTDRISLLLYTRTCAVVRGQPARLAGATS